MSGQAVAEFENIGKIYRTGIFGQGQRTALERFSLRINRAEVFALLGPNRAGKTTLVKLLLSLCRPTSGRGLRFGRPLAERRTLARVGYVHEHPAFPRYLSPQELLEYYGALALLEEGVVRTRTGALLDLVGLADRRLDPIACFSKGMVQRLALAQALLNDPELLVLDEPSEGLDLAGRRLVREVIAERRQRGLTVLLVSHVLGEVEQVCDRLGVIVGGGLVFCGTAAELARDPRTGTPCPLEEALERLYSAAPPGSPAEQQARPSP
jgi:ABC-2 type transport system ATP-binding protein